MTMELADKFKYARERKLIHGTDVSLTYQEMDLAQAALRASAVQGEPVAWTNEAQLGFLKDPTCADIPMAMWIDWEIANAVDAAHPSEQDGAKTMREALEECVAMIRQLRLEVPTKAVAALAHSRQNRGCT